MSKKLRLWIGTRQGRKQQTAKYPTWPYRSWPSNNNSKQKRWVSPPKLLLRRKLSQCRLVTCALRVGWLKQLVTLWRHPSIEKDKEVVHDDVKDRCKVLQMKTCQQTCCGTRPVETWLDFTDSDCRTVEGHYCQTGTFWNTSRGSGRQPCKPGCILSSMSTGCQGGTPHITGADYHTGTALHGMSRKTLWTGSFLFLLICQQSKKLKRNTACPLQKRL